MNISVSSALLVSSDPTSARFEGYLDLRNLRFNIGALINRIGFWGPYLDLRNLRFNIGALVVRIGFWGPLLCYSYVREPPK